MKKKPSKKQVKRGKRDRELDIARQQELFPESFFKPRAKQAELPFAEEARVRPVQQTLFDDVF